MISILKEIEEKDVVLQIDSPPPKVEPPTERKEDSSKDYDANIDVEDDEGLSLPSTGVLQILGSRNNSKLGTVSDFKKKIMIETTNSNDSSSKRKKSSSKRVTAQKPPSKVPTNPSIGLVRFTS